MQIQKNKQKKKLVQNLIHLNLLTATPGGVGKPESLSNKSPEC